MAQCRWCERKGWFLSVDGAGFCDASSARARFTIEQKLRVATDSFELMRKGKTLATRLGRCDLAIQICADLLPHEQAGFPVSEPPISTLLAQCQAYRPRIVLKETASKLSAVDAKAAAAGTPKQQATALRKGLVAIAESRAHLPASADLDAVERDLRRRIQHLELGGILELAAKAEFKGQSKKATGLYEDALFQIMHDDIDDAEQQDMIDSIQRRLDAIAGDAPVENKPEASSPVRDPVRLSIVPPPVPRSDNEE